MFTEAYPIVFSDKLLNALKFPCIHNQVRFAKIENS